MKSQELTKLKVPDVPGVYLFKEGRRILYIGKATSLKSRVQSYFNKNTVEARGPRILRMVEISNTVEFQKTDSVLEALILEAELIKRYQPPYNVDAKDDKSWNYVLITKEDFPRVLTVRAKDLPFFEIPVQFQAGPFPHSAELKSAMKIIRKIFPYRDTCVPFKEQALRQAQGKSCFNAQIGLCPGVCDGRIRVREYARSIRHLKLFFKGKKSELTRVLTSEMKSVVREKNFEEAARLRDQLFALSHIRDVAMIKADQNPSATLGATHGARIEAYDISHISGTSAVGVMVVLQGGLLAKGEYRKFKLRMQKNDDTGALREVLTRRLTHREWHYPSLIVVDGGLGQKNVAEEILKKAGLTIPVIAVTKNERHKPDHLIGDALLIRDYHDDILAINAEVHRFAIAYHRYLREKIK